MILSFEIISSHIRSILCQAYFDVDIKFVIPSDLNLLKLIRLLLMINLNTLLINRHCICTGT